MKNDTINIALVGDVAPVGPAEIYILKNSSLFSNHLEQIFSHADIIFANLEVPITLSNVKSDDKKYIFKSDPDVLKHFPKNMLFSLANNHIFDYGIQGLQDTIAHLNANNFKFTGAGMNIEEASKPIIVNKNGTSTAFLAAADPRYHPAGDLTPGTLPALPDLLFKKISYLKTIVDYVYVSIHMGMEFIPIPTPSIRQLEDICKESGADVVAFHHSHTVSGFSTAKKNTSFYGLGNFIFHQNDNYPFKPWFDSVVWNVTHKKETADHQVKLTPFRIDTNGIPYEASRDHKERIEKNIEFLNKSINAKKNVSALRLRYILSPGYLRILWLNYYDIAKRKGIKKTIALIYSSVKTLFAKK